MMRKGAIAVALLVATFSSRGLFEPPSIPYPATDAMEPQVRESIVSARKAVAENLGSGEAWGRLGMVFHAHYLETEAAPCYTEARELAPRDFRWPYLLARILRTRDPDRALVEIEEAARRSSEYAPILLLKAELLEARGDVENALTSYRQALSLDFGSAAAELGIGRLLLANGDLVESAKHLERAAELAPEAGAVHASLSQLYHRQRHEEQASEAGASARRLHPELDPRDPVLASVMEQAVSIAGLQSRAVEAERAGDSMRAEGLLRRAIEIRPDDTSLHYNLGNHLSRQGRIREAEDSYRRALTLDAGHVATLVNLGILVSQSGGLDEGKKLFEKALEREPAHPGALLGLGNVLASEGRLGSATRFFERALESDPNRPDVHYALARALAARGETAGAIEHFERALEGAPERGDIHLHLAALRRFRATPCFSRPTPPLPGVCQIKIRFLICIIPCLSVG